MSNKLSKYIKKLVLGKDQNLVSIDDPYEAIGRLLAGRTITGILDAGASDGHISQRMLKYFPQAHVYAFEPNPVYRARLEQLNARQPGIVPVFAALSDQEGTVNLHVTVSPGSTSIYKPAERLTVFDPEGSKVSRIEKAEMVTIDGWLCRNGKHPIHLMKFDIQGAELLAMNGARQTLTEQTLAVYTEVWFNQAYEKGAVFAQIDLFLRDLGYIAYDIYKPRYHDNGMLLWGNVLYLHAGRMGLGC
ncbi:MAG TPA: FkbM family methyltransferase [Sedimentisphaerales bacterium]|nr:FkbM family methyltransferase [Sedimentisphaerales bacterium]